MEMRVWARQCPALCDSTINSLDHYELPDELHQSIAQTGVRQHMPYQKMTEMPYGINRNIEWSPDSTQFAVSDLDGGYIISLFDSESGECQRQLRGHGSLVNTLPYRKDGKQLASGDDDMIVYLWNLETGEYQHKLRGHYNPVYRPDGKQLASTSRDHNIYVWNSESGACLHILSKQQRPLYRPDGKQLLSSSKDDIFSFWNTENGTLQHTLESPQGKRPPDWAYVYSPDSEQFALSLQDGTVRLLNSTNGECQDLEGIDTERVFQLIYSPDGTRVAGRSKSRVSVWNTKNRRPQYILAGYQGEESLDYTYAYSPDGEHFALGSKDGRVHVFNPKNGECQSILPGYGKAAHQLTYSPDGKRLELRLPAQLIMWSSSDKVLKACDGIPIALLCALASEAQKSASRNNISESQQLCAAYETLANSQEPEVQAFFERSIQPYITRQ